MYELETMISLEFKRLGIHTAHYYSDGPNAGSMFRQLARQARHGTHNAMFLGGILLTNYIDPRHVVGIVSVHESRIPKIKIADTGPKVSRPIVRSVPLEWLTRNAATPDILLDDEPAAVGFIGFRYDYIDTFSNGVAARKNIDLEYQEELHLRDLLLERAFS